MVTHDSPSQPSVVERLERARLIDTIRNRRSRRFGAGFRLNGGPLKFDSALPAQPLTLEEEAVLAFAANGITGYPNAELPFQTGDVPEAGGGNIMTHFVGRTVASGDGIHAATVFVTNDQGAWMLRRPQDYPRDEAPALVAMAQRGEYVQLYERMRVRISDKRVTVPEALPFVPPFNKWSANQPGSTYFVVIHELSAYLINVLLSAFSEDFGYFIIDERTLKPAGIGRFAKSAGGHLDDDPRHGRLAWISFMDAWLCEFATWEQGAIMQNLALMTEALGLGGFPHFAAHPFVWQQAFGFRMQDVPNTRVLGVPPLMAKLAQWLGRELPVPTAVGLELDGQPLIKPYCPPYYPNMEAAVRAYVDYKTMAGSGTQHDGGQNTAWKDGAAVQRGIPLYSERAIEATVAYCEYVYRKYGRFPAISGPFRTLLAYQAHHLDPAFYTQFYK